MEILLTKTGAENHILSCKRKDGSVTWRHVSSFFIMHDLCHYAVETTLLLKNAFYGMVAAGTDITDFDLPKDKRNFELTHEAIYVEHLVNLLVIDYTQGRMETLVEIVETVYEEHKQTYILTKEEVEKMRVFYNNLMTRWRLLPLNETMTLQFEE